MMSSHPVSQLFLRTTLLSHLHPARHWRMITSAKHGHTMILLLPMITNVMEWRMLDLASLVSTLLSVLMVLHMLNSTFMMDDMLYRTNQESLRHANQRKRERGHSSSAMCFLVTWETRTGALLLLKQFVKKLLMKSFLITSRQRIKQKAMSLANWELRVLATTFLC
jgi:archaellum biogenesis protein FlaJ (TadC family)